MPSIGAAVGVGGAILGSSSSNKSAKAANRAADASYAAAELQAEVSREQLDFAKEQWSLYTDTVMPLELEAMQMGISAQELALQRGELDFKLYEDYYAPVQKMMAETAMQGPDYGRYTSRAAAEVDKQFEVQRGMQQRGMERAGVRPDSGRYQEADRTMDISRAATRAAAVNDATNYAEDVNFNRQATFLGRQPSASAPTQQTSMPGLNPQAVSSMMSAAGSGIGSSANTYANLAQQHGTNASNTMQAGINLGYDLYQTVGNPSTGGFLSSNQFANPIMYGPNKLADGGYIEPESYASGGSVSQAMGPLREKLAGLRPRLQEVAAGGGQAQPKDPRRAIGFLSRYLDERQGGASEQFGYGGQSPQDISAIMPAVQLLTLFPGLMQKIAAQYGGGVPEQAAGVRARLYGGQSYANGGMVQTPNGMRMAVGGPPGVDQIPATIDGVRPARLNGGEVVIPADVVSRKGTDFFEKLIEQYHEDPQPRPIPGVGLQRRPH